VAPATTPTTWSSAAELAALHACRTQDELEQLFVNGLRELFPGAAAALCLAGEEEGTLMVRAATGACPVAELQRVTADAWPLPAAQRHAIAYGDHQLGELWLDADPDPASASALRDALTHFGTALVNLALNVETRQATDDYCASLQALEEGIVLFQEADSEAVMARVLALATGMVQATAGALFVLEEVGNPESALRLEQALGIPDALIESFRTEQGEPWPPTLLDWPAQIVTRDEAGAIAGLAAGCVPAVLKDLVVLPLRYHGVVAGVCVLFNPLLESSQTGDAIGRLQSFGQLAAALLHRLNLERMREESISIGRELEIAETIQKRLVPTEAPPCEGYEFAWRSLAAKSIGGDCVDWTMSDLGDVYAIVADASGHGINSALLMTSFRSNYRGSAAWLEPCEVAAALNTEVVHDVGPTGMFITAVMARIQPETRRLTLCSAGHNPSMIYRADSGQVEQVEAHGPPMGFMAGVDYEQHETSLSPGDVLLLYTDGVTEAVDAELDMFGEQRLEAVLREHANGTAQGVLDATMAALEAFCGRDCHDDDVSLMVIKAE